jgi:hypothetical protein
MHPYMSKPCTMPLIASACAPMHHKQLARAVAEHYGYCSSSSSRQAGASEAMQPWLWTALARNHDSGGSCTQVLRW